MDEEISGELILNIIRALEKIGLNSTQILDFIKYAMTGDPKVLENLESVNK